jgi:hypothetical protein
MIVSVTLLTDLKDAKRVLNAIPQPNFQTDLNTIVYITKTGTKYHRAGCRSLSKSAIPMALKDAAAKYGPCGICNPPILGRPAAKAEAILVPSAPVTKAQPAGNGDLIVYVTKTGTKYHRAGCRSLSRSAIPMSLKEAVAKRFGPCSICKPPILDKRPQAEVFACCHVR